MQLCTYYTNFRYYFPHFMSSILCISTASIQLLMSHFTDLNDAKPNNYFGYNDWHLSNWILCMSNYLIWMNSLNISFGWRGYFLNLFKMQCSYWVCVFARPRFFFSNRLTLYLLQKTALMAFFAKLCL